MDHSKTDLVHQFEEEGGPGDHIRCAIILLGDRYLSTKETSWRSVAIAHFLRARG